MRDRPTIVAPPYMSGPITQVDFGHHAPVSAVTAAAAAKADVACPEGNDCRSPFASPLNNLKSRGLVSLETNGLARPAIPLSTHVTTSATATASVPCQPRSATRS